MSGFSPSSTRIVFNPSLLHAPIVCRAEFDWMSRPTTTVSGCSAMARARRNSRLRSLLPPNATPVRSSRLMKMRGPPRARDRFGASSIGVGVRASFTRGMRAMRSRIQAYWAAPPLASFIIAPLVRPDRAIVGRGHRGFKLAGARPGMMPTRDRPGIAGRNGAARSATTALNLVLVVAAQKGLSQVRHRSHARCRHSPEACMAETIQIEPVQKADDKPPVVVKKYANRRLYNTESSSYITLDNLADMVRQGRDFVVYDAKTGEDITRSVLTQIIVEEEGKGRALLPTAFLRQLIGFYGDQMQSLVPRFLEQALGAFAEQQEQVRATMQKTMGSMGTLFPFGNMEEVSRQNMAMMERAFSLFTPFYRGATGQDI